MICTFFCMYSNPKESTVPTTWSLQCWFFVLHLCNESIDNVIDEETITMLSIIDSDYVLLFRWWRSMAAINNLCVNSYVDHWWWPVATKLWKNILVQYWILLYTIPVKWCLVAVSTTHCSSQAACIQGSLTTIKINYIIKDAMMALGISIKVDGVH